MGAANSVPGMVEEQIRQIEALKHRNQQEAIRRHQEALRKQAQKRAPTPQEPPKPPPLPPRSVKPHTTKVEPSTPATYHKPTVHTPVVVHRQVQKAAAAPVIVEATGAVVNGQTLGFTDKLQRSFAKTEVMASALAGAVVGVMGGSTATTRIAYGLLGGSMPVVAYALVSGDENFM